MQLASLTLTVIGNIFQSIQIKLLNFTSLGSNRIRGRNRIDMLFVLGVLILSCGFLAPFLNKGGIPPVVFFWIGFFILLSSGKHYPRYALWMKWGRVGVLINAIGTLILVQIMGVLVLSKEYDILSIALKGNYILSPISILSKYLFPHPRVESADGITTSALSYLRYTTTSLLDVLVFIGIGLLVCKLFIKKAHHETVSL